MRPKHGYLLLCVAGTVLPYSQFIPFLQEHGLDVELFFEQLFSNRIGGFFGWDVIVSSVVLWALVFIEGRRAGVRHLWAPIVSNLAVGVSLGLPLFLYLRERRLERGGVRVMAWGAAFAAAWLATALLAAPARAQDVARPYAGLETREIKALSTEEIAALRAGEGMGYALAAELNHYPGPRHVLDLADSLGLSAEQRAGIEAARDVMRARALALGDSLIDAEAALDGAFASAAIDEAGLERGVAGIARLEGALRATHLAAHLVTRRLLTPAQVERYDALRGYGADADHEAADHDHGPDN